MKKTIFTGAACAIVTPFHEDGSINYPLFGELIDFQIAGGTDALVVAGTTGEASTLTDDEHVEIIRYAVEKTAGRVPVIAGTGSNDTAYAIWLTKEAARVGADATLQVTPYYNKCSQKGLIAHFTAIADATELPVILYNVPSRTGVDIKPVTYKALSAHERIVAAKEANGNLSSIAETRALCGEDLDIYSGNDDQIVPILSMGGKGVISVLSNILPQQTHDICADFFAGNIEKSAAAQLKHLALINALFCDVNPIPVKEALRQMGYPVGGYRLPLCEMDDSPKKQLIDALRSHNLI